MIAAAVCFTVMCLSAWAVCALADAEDAPNLFDPWDES